MAKKSFEHLVWAEYEAEANYETARYEYNEAREARREAEDKIEKAAKTRYGPPNGED